LSEVNRGNLTVPYRRPTGESMGKGVAVVTQKNQYLQGILGPQGESEKSVKWAYEETPTASMTDQQRSGKVWDSKERMDGCRNRSS